MARKYVKDYRLEHILTSAGKPKTIAVYQGDWFEFTAPPETIRQTRTRYLILSIAASLSLLWLLVFTDRMGGSWYVTMPAALSLIFLFFAGLSVYRLMTANGPVTREHKDKTHDRMAAMSLIVTILAGLCLIGSVYHLIAVEAGLWQFLYAGFAAVYTASALGMFLSRGALEMKKSDKRPRMTEDL